MPGGSEGGRWAGPAPAAEAGKDSGGAPPPARRIAAGVSSRPWLAGWNFEGAREVGLKPDSVGSHPRMGPTVFTGTPVKVVSQWPWVRY